MYQTISQRKESIIYTFSIKRVKNNYKKKILKCIWSLRSQKRGKFKYDNSKNKITDWLTQKLLR